MFALANYPRRRGHSTDSFGYVCAVESFSSIRDRLQARVRMLATQGPHYALCGHSLGGLLALLACADCDDSTMAPSALITLGTPLQPARLARRFVRSRWYRVASGSGGQLLADSGFFESLPTPPVPWLRIVGTGGPTGRLSPFGHETNDGVVAHVEAGREGAPPGVLVDAVHTFLMNSSAARAAIEDFLRRVPSDPPGQRCSN
jgi:pimeloyl-ACP methyl ester carboxylesterase